MSDDDIPASLAEAMAEIRRLRGEAATMPHPSGEVRLSTYVPPEYVALPKAELVRLHARIAELEFYDAMMAEYRRDRDRLQARVAELEGAAAITFGTLEQPTPDEPATYTHNVPPSAPPHNE